MMASHVPRSVLLLEIKVIFSTGGQSRRSDAEWMLQAGSKTVGAGRCALSQSPSAASIPRAVPLFADHVSAMLSLNRAPVGTSRSRIAIARSPQPPKKKPRRHDLPPELEPALLRPAKPLAPKPKLERCDYGEACNRAVLYL